jgi:hypothetical protein
VELDFLKKELASSIQPHFGEHFADVTHIRQDNPMFRIAPVYSSSLVEQVAALPLGAKLLLHPWDGSLELLHPAPVVAPAPRERPEFAVNAVMPVLEYMDEKLLPHRANSSSEVGGQPK